MTAHDRFQDDVPAYVAGRLTGEERARLEEHLEQCVDCRLVAATGRDLALAMSEAGESLFEPHPGIEDLRGFATDRSPEAREEITRHIDICMSCALEVEAWRSRGGVRGMRPPEGKSAEKEAGRQVPAAGGTGLERKPSRVAAVAGLSAAAGLVLGVGIGALIYRATVADGSAGAASSWAGPTAQILLPGVLRGGDAPALPHRILNGEERVVFSFPSLDSNFRNGESRYRFQITGASSGVILSHDMSGSEAARHVDAAGVITFDLPASRLASDRYECRVLSSDGTVLYTASVELQKGD